MQHYDDKKKKMKSDGNESPYCPEKRANPVDVPKNQPIIDSNWVNKKPY